MFLFTILCPFAANDVSKDLVQVIQVLQETKLPTTPMLMALYI